MRPEKLRLRECPKEGCDTDELTQKQFMRHADEEHEADILPEFPLFYVCEGGDEEAADCYLALLSDAGPALMAYEGRDYIDEVGWHQLLAHDWQVCLREETPFEDVEVENVYPTKENIGLPYAKVADIRCPDCGKISTYVERLGSREPPATKLIYRARRCAKCGAELDQPVPDIVDEIEMIKIGPMPNAVLEEVPE